MLPRALIGLTQQAFLGEGRATRKRRVGRPAMAHTSACRTEENPHKWKICVSKSPFRLNPFLSQLGRDYGVIANNRLVATSGIQDPAVKRMTELRCTNKHPYGLDEAPVCSVIRVGEYEVDGVRYP